MICYAVIDTNVFVSALISNYADAVTVQLVGRVISGEIIPVYSDEIMREYREVLGRKKFRFEQVFRHNLLFPRAMSQAAAKQTFGECREGQIPRPLGRFKFDAPLLAAGFLTVTAREMLNILDGKDVS